MFQFRYISVEVEVRGTSSEVLIASCAVWSIKTRFFASFLADGKFSYFHTSATSIGAERGLAIILLRI